jgi:phage-related protein
MTWAVEILNEVVETELLELPADMQAAFARLVERIMAVGLERVREPHVKHVDGKLWEMRFNGRDGIARAIYVTASGRRIIILHAFVKKTQKIPRAALILALDRAKEIDR